MSKTFNTNWTPYGKTGNTYYDYSNTNDLSLNIAMQNYMRAASNYEKAFVDISYCLNTNLINQLAHSTNNKYNGVPYRHFDFVDGGSLDLPTGTITVANPVTGGSTSNALSFSNINGKTFTMNDILANGPVAGSYYCAALFNNANGQSSNINPNQVVPNTTVSSDWVIGQTGHGLLDYTYYELQKAVNDLSNNYSRQSSINYGTDKPYQLIDIDVSYQNIVNMRDHLDKQVQQIYTLHNNAPVVTVQEYDSAIFAGLLWTILAIVILYYVFMKL
jgi:hypothetical protein